MTEKLQDIVSGAWVNFARSGNPNGGVVPSWDRFTGDQVQTMIFDRECVMAVDHDKELAELAPARKMDFSKLMGSKK